MSALRRHPLVRADIGEAINWCEDRQPGLGLELAKEFLAFYRKLKRNPQRYAIRFTDVRRLNFDRFPYGLFYVIRKDEVWLLAVLHASRDSERILAQRRKFSEIK